MEKIIFKNLPGTENLFKAKELNLTFQKSFSLVELVIYIGIGTTILVLLTVFLWLIILGSVKETSYEEIQQNGRFVMLKMSQEIRKATRINSPAPGKSATSLSLSMAEAGLNPTIFDVVDGKLRITQGNNPFSYLTTDQVIVSNLQFTNLSYPATPGTIRVEMTIEYKNPGKQIEYQASMNLKSSINLVP